MKLNAFWKTYDLELVKDTYTVNNRPYFGLVDTDPEDWGPFCDLSENHPEFTDEQLNGRLPGHQAIIIDNTFLMCFDEPRLAKIWIKENIPECVITWDIDWRDCFYIKLPDTDQWN